MPMRPVCGVSVTLTTRPPRPDGMKAFVATACVMSHVPSRFRRTTVRKPLGVMSSAGREILAAGVVDEDVDAAVALERAVDERVDLVLLADVADDALDAAGRGERRRLLQRLDPAPADDDRRAEARELERGRAADARAAAADDRDLPVEDALGQDGLHQ